MYCHRWEGLRCFLRFILNANSSIESHEVLSIYEAWLSRLYGGVTTHSKAKNYNSNNRVSIRNWITEIHQSAISQQIIALYLHSVALVAFRWRGAGETYRAEKEETQRRAIPTESVGTKERKVKSFTGKWEKFHWSWLIRRSASAAVTRRHGLSRSTVCFCMNWHSASSTPAPQFAYESAYALAL